MSVPVWSWHIKLVDRERNTHKGHLYVVGSSVRKIRFAEWNRKQNYLVFHGHTFCINVGNWLIFGGFPVQLEVMQIFDDVFVSIILGRELGPSGVSPN